jgi:hypothetical protein
MYCGSSSRLGSDVIPLRLSVPRSLYFFTRYHTRTT